MSDPIQLIVAFGQAISTMSLYNDAHPARERAGARSYRWLRARHHFDPTPRFPSLGGQASTGGNPLRWPRAAAWGPRPARVLLWRRWPAR